MEVYVLLGLVSLGYMFTKRETAPSTTTAAPAAPLYKADELPAHRRYSPQQTIADVRTQEMLLAQDGERAARYPMQTGAVDPRARAYTRNPLDSGVPGPNGGPVRSVLAGVDFEAADFRHNNMQPFFGSHVPSASGDNGALLERYTGAPGVATSHPKREIPSLFPPEAKNVYGNQPYADALQGRYGDMNAINRVRNNELPFEQARVGPGVGQGFTSGGTGGFAQNQDREFVMPRYKDVDALRPGNKPKVNLEGRANAGAVRGGMRGLMGEASKNKPHTAWEIEEFGQVPTRAASADAPQVRPDPLHGKRLRSPPSAFRVEPAGATGPSGLPVPLSPDQVNRFGAPKFSQETPALTGAGRVGIGDAAREDMHRSFGELGDNERTLSQKRWSDDRPDVENAGSAVLRSGPPGAVHVPGRDVRAHVDEGTRLSGREAMSDAGPSHVFGMISPQAPSRGPAYDPDLHRPRQRGCLGASRAVSTGPPHFAPHRGSRSTPGLFLG